MTYAFIFISNFLTNQISINNSEVQTCLVDLYQPNILRLEHTNNRLTSNSYTVFVSPKFTLIQLSDLEYTKTGVWKFILNINNNIQLYSLKISKISLELSSGVNKYFKELSSNFFQTIKSVTNTKKHNSNKPFEVLSSYFTANSFQYSEGW